MHGLWRYSAGQEKAPSGDAGGSEKVFAVSSYPKKPRRRNEKARLAVINWQPDDADLHHVHRGADRAPEPRALLVASVVAVLSGLGAENWFAGGTR